MIWLLGFSRRHSKATVVGSKVTRAVATPFPALVPGPLLSPNPVHPRTSRHRSVYPVVGVCVSFLSVELVVDMATRAKYIHTYTLRPTTLDFFLFLNYHSYNIINISLPLYFVNVCVYIVKSLSQSSMQIMIGIFRFLSKWSSYQLFDVDCINLTIRIVCVSCFLVYILE